MNKRQAKKRLKKAIEVMKTSCKSGYEIFIKNQAYVDKYGRECDPTNCFGRLIILKRPKIQIIKTDYGSNS